MPRSRAPTSGIDPISPKQASLGTSARARAMRRRLEPTVRSKNSKSFIPNGPGLRAAPALACQGSPGGPPLLASRSWIWSPGLIPPRNPPKCCCAGPRTGRSSGRPARRTRPGTECPPDRWWEALTAAGRDLLERAAAVGVAAQQHGMVVLDESGAVIRDAMLWNDVKSAPQAAALVTEFGGPAEWAARTGSVPTMSFTVTKLRWLAENEPGHAARVHRVLLPHDWLTWKLAGGDPRAEPTTDRGDASGTGYFSPAEGAWLPDYAERALGRPVALPRVAGPAEVVGRTSWGAALSAGHRGQHGRGARARPARRRRGGVHRHLGDGLRGHRARSPPIPPGWSAGSPTRPAGTCRSPARSTRPGCST